MHATFMKVNLRNAKYCGGQESTLFGLRFLSITKEQRRQLWEISYGDGR